MNDRTQEILHRYLDDQLSDVEFDEFQDILKEKPEFLSEFVKAAMLHDRLRGHFVAKSSLDQEESTRRDESNVQPKFVSSWHRNRSWINALIGGGIAVIAMISFTFWRGDDRKALGVQAELVRVIEASASQAIRAYRIDVERNEIGAARRHRDPNDNRPLKPPMDGAVLYVRGNDEFVLKRKTVDGKDFVLGCDGVQSWAVRPDGPVRASADLSRFNRDVPGHEFSMPLINIGEALTQLKEAFELNLMPNEYDENSSSDRQVRRLLVAVKKRGFPGPRRVEIEYFAESGELAQLRFVEMPYGPDRLTLRMTLIEAPSLPSNIFSHSAYHDTSRRVEIE